MERIVLSPLPVTLDREKLMEQNHIPADSDLAEDFADLVEAAGKVLCCKTILVKAEGNADFPLPPGIRPKYYYAMTVGRELGMQSVSFLNPGSAEGWEDKLINKNIAALTKAEDIGILVDDRGNMTPWYSTVGIFTEA